MSKFLFCPPLVLALPKYIPKMEQNSMGKFGKEIHPVYISKSLPFPLIKAEKQFNQF